VSREDLAWAMTNYTGDRGVGQRFHDIEYDLGLDGLTSLDAPLDGRASVFSLPVLRSAGGVCRHQAYFAASIGKAIGVPTVWIRADGPDVGHAWVGYLTQRGRNAAWDVNEGRFGFYDRVRGEVRCPQTGREFSDQAIAMKADFFGASLQDRLRGRALAVAAIVLADAEANPDTTPWPPTLPEGLRTVDQTARLSSRQRRAMALSEPRAANAENRFDLLEMSVDAAPASMFAWRLMSAWSDDMDLARRQRWFEAASTLVGKRYPDVLRELVAPMIAGMDDHEARDAAWGWLAARMAKHPELALDVETARAGDLIERGEGEAAWQGLGDAARRYVRDVPGVVDTLRIAEGIASKAPNGPAALADLYGEVYSKSPPAEANLPPPYDRASVRSRLGRRYVYWLKKAGRADEARRIEQTLTGSSRP
jgi:hypothetical protein